LPKNTGQVQEEAVEILNEKHAVHESEYAEVPFAAAVELAKIHKVLLLLAQHIDALEATKI
jgi:hypothetical protein